MAIGLDDLKNLKKKKRSTKDTRPSTSTPVSTRLPSKPWSNRGLQSAAKMRRAESDSHMNQDWLEIQGQSLFLMDLNFQYEQIAEDTGRRLHKQLAYVERNVLDSLDKIKNFWGFITAQKK